MTKHLSRRDLLLFVDGELSLGRMRAAHEHLYSCWNCRRDLEGLERDINAIVDAQNHHFLPSAPGAVRPWTSFEEMVASLPARQSLFGPLFRKARRLAGGDPFGSLRWTVAVVTLLCVVVGAFWITPARLSAAVVMRNVLAADVIATRTAAGQVIRERVRIERRDRHGAAGKWSEVESWKEGNRTVWRGGGSDLHRRYQERQIDMELPLAAVACERWLRETGANPKVSKRAGIVELRADAAGPDSDLQSVSLRVRSDIWRVEGVRLTFTDGIFDVSEVDFTVLKRDEIAPDLLEVLEPSALAPMAVDAKRLAESYRDPLMPSVSGASPAVNLSEVELRIQFRLHEMGADLSEPIELNKGTREIVISARGASPERKQQLAAAFGGGQPFVRLELDAGVSSAGNLRELPAIAASGADLSSVPDKQLAEFFGDAAAQERFARMVLEADSSVLAHLYALRNLAVLWPADVEANLSGEGRGELRTMVEDHRRALRTTLPELKALLLPLIQKFCPGGAASSPSPHPFRWRQSASVLQTARSLDRTLRALLTTSANATNLANSCPDISADLLSLDTLVSESPLAP